MRRVITGLLAVAVLLAACSSDGKKPAASKSSSSAPVASSAPSDAPPGFVPITTPTGVNPDLFGQNVAVTTTKDNQPVVAFSVHAADGDASTVMTSTFDPATGKYRDPTTVATGVLDGHVHSVSITRDDASGTLVVAWDDGGQIKLSQSKDDGTSWLEPVTVATNSGAHAPSVASANGKLFISLADDDDNVSLATGDLSSTSFTVTAAPQPGGGSPLREEFAPVSVAPDGSFGVAYLYSPNGSNGAGVAYLKAGSPAPVTVMQTNTQNDQPNVALAYNDQGPVIAATICMTVGEPGACTYVATSADGGATFGAPASVPGDTGQGAPAALAMFVSGTSAVLSYVPSSGTSGAKCGNPKLVVSTDLQSWGVCTPGIDPALGLVAGVPALAGAGQGKFVLAFQQTATQAQSPTGILVTTQSL
jgi:hypothetical protein